MLQHVVINFPRASQSVPYWLTSSSKTTAGEKSVICDHLAWNLAFVERYKVVLLHFQTSDPVNTTFSCCQIIITVWKSLCEFQIKPFRFDSSLLQVSCSYWHSTNSSSLLSWQPLLINCWQWESLITHHVFSHSAIHLHTEKIYFHIRRCQNLQNNKTAEHHNKLKLQPKRNSSKYSNLLLLFNTVWSEKLRPLVRVFALTSASGGNLVWSNSVRHINKRVRPSLVVEWRTSCVQSSLVHILYLWISQH